MVITDCSATNMDFITLFHIFRATLKPDMQFRQFKAYYNSGKLEYIDATLVLAGEIVVGFCAAAFYSTVINGGQYTVGRAATGILPDYRGNKLPKWKLYLKYIRYWLRHPFRKTILSAYVANPLIYAMICKYTGIAYPRRGTEPPKDIVVIKEELVKSQNLHKTEHPFVVEIHFCVEIGEKEQERIFKSKNKDVIYYLRINPKFRNQHGVIVLIPINLKNVMLSILRFLYYGILVKIIMQLAAWLQKGALP
jgi:hypothetical protein